MIRFRWAQPYGTSQRNTWPVATVSLLRFGTEGDTCAQIHLRRLKPAFVRPAAFVEEGSERTSATDSMNVQSGMTVGRLEGRLKSRHAARPRLADADCIISAPGRFVASSSRGDAPPSHPCLPSAPTNSGQPLSGNADVRPQPRLDLDRPPGLDGDRRGRSGLRAHRVLSGEDQPARRDGAGDRTLVRNHRGERGPDDAGLLRQSARRGRLRRHLRSRGPGARRRRDAGGRADGRVRRGRHGADRPEHEQRYTGRPAASRPSTSRPARSSRHATWRQPNSTAVAPDGSFVAVAIETSHEDLDDGAIRRCRPASSRS